ncbi:low molecular weight phosphatase family protein [Salinadaptatus halalkaliphilus]|uniref:Low molecular weight phosphatase family protein n=1 Tax=Salinadaptatus halalkaliphilus TaxID=2419781 RepID=A0A4S3TGV4_9EURY|nr:low molecular weight phosphatase family protein [Salinadaptatus halalkaliphilus]THE63204.1 low molecular weight phosphatase family protein [Salinadaptatus halalkaliphilus]
MADRPIQVAFVCVQNAGRSQMATAFAERERRDRDLEDEVVVHTGGTDPADEVHDVVVEAMAERDVDIGDRVPQAISTDTLADCEYVATMGCSTLELDDDVDVRDWALEDPHGEDLETVREIRAEIEGNVADLFDEIAPDTNR